MRAKERDKDAAMRIREGIESGRLMPNERLVEAEISAWLGTNRANVRMALSRLEQEGLVVSEPNRGARVRRISESEAIEITQVRIALEGLVAREAALRATKSDIEKLQEIADAMRAAYTSGDLFGYSQLNGKFHSEIRRISAHQTAARILSSLNSHIVRLQFRVFTLPGRIAESLAEHERIITALADRQPDRAEAAMRQHLDQVANGLRAAAAFVNA